jgi:hypothetical protein
MAFKLREATKEKPIIHAYVATPAYDGKVDTDFAMSLAEACQAATIFGIRVTAAVMGNGAFIDLARNNFVQLFLKTDCTHLFFIDADLKFEPRAFVSLLRSGKPVAAGAYRRRQKNEDYPIKLADYPEGGGLWVEDDWVLCDRVPTGFLCIERSVIEEMAEESQKIILKDQDPVPRLFYTYLDEMNRFVGEDFAWCDDYIKKYKKRIHVWPDFDFVHGKYECNYYKYLTAEIEKEQAEKSKATQSASAA